MRVRALVPIWMLPCNDRKKDCCLVLIAAVCCLIACDCYFVITSAANMCRVYAGIHFLHDVTDGRIVGNQVSNILSVLRLICVGLPVQVS